MLLYSSPDRILSLCETIHTHTQVTIHADYQHKFLSPGLACCIRSVQPSYIFAYLKYNLGKNFQFKVQINNCLNTPNCQLNIIYRLCDAYKCNLIYNATDRSFGYQICHENPNMYAALSIQNQPSYNALLVAYKQQYQPHTNFNIAVYAGLSRNWN